MVIKSKFYFHDKGKFFEYGGILELSKRQIVKLGRVMLDSGHKTFCYDDTNFTITCEDSERKYKVAVNRIITDASDRTVQKEYLTKLGWWQQQKLLWMFKRHWLQQQSTKKHFVILLMIISVGYFLVNLVVSS
ncbi:hypothetical protein BH11BAC2_BH11BAC2_11300 [soil metagenome]